LIILFNQIHSIQQQKKLTKTKATENNYLKNTWWQIDCVVFDCCFFFLLQQQQKQLNAILAFFIFNLKPILNE